MKKLILAILILASTAAFSADNRQPLVLHFNSVGTLLMVDVRINGELKHMLFDSGAQQTALNAKVSKDRVMTGILDTGNYRFFNFEIVLSNMQSMFNVLGSGDGVLGQDYIRKFKSVSIDYSSETITLTP